MAGKKYPEQVYIEEEKNEKYMEGNYDGDADQQYKQERADKRRSLEIEEEIEYAQGYIYERETERLSCEYKVVGEKFVQLMRDYIEENKYQQYLVDGAVLRCDQAMTDDVVFTEWGEKVVLENKADEVCNIILNVSENPVYEDDDSENSMTINGLRYAIVKDTIKNVNIIVPKCNCRLAADREKEEERIRNDLDRNKNGVCMHLMRLNEEWDNYEVKDAKGFAIKYAKRVNVAPSPFSAGAGRVLDESEDVVWEEVEGITMTSVLFCKHGGLIMPVTSGQTAYSEEEIILIYTADKNAKVSGLSGEPGEGARKGAQVLFDFATREYGSGFGVDTPNYYLMHHSNQYYDENGLSRISKIPGKQTNEDYYCVAMAPGFITKASGYSTPATEGNINFGYRFLVRLCDEEGKNYDLDVIVVDEKHSEDRNDFYPHNNIVEFVTGNNINDAILEGGNVSFDKLLCGTQLEIEEVYAYKEGAYITGNYWQPHWEDR